MYLYQLSTGERQALIRYAATRDVPLPVAATEYVQLVETSRFQAELAQYLASFSRGR